MTTLFPLASSGTSSGRVWDHRQSGQLRSNPAKRQAATFGESPYRYQNVYTPLDNGPALSRRAFA